VSTFQVAATIASFTVNQDGFTERRDTLLRVWELELFLALSTDYTTLAALMSAPYHVGVCPGSAGVTYYVDIGGGAGQGTLTLDNVVGSPFTAALVRMERPSAYPSGARKVRATFQECPP
jgi:hypothetical protein